MANFDGVDALSKTKNDISKFHIFLSIVGRLLSFRASIQLKRIENESSFYQ